MSLGICLKNCTSLKLACLNISAKYHQKSILIILSYTVSKFAHFLRHIVDNTMKRLCTQRLNVTIDDDIQYIRNNPAVLCTIYTQHRFAYSITQWHSHMCSVHIQMIKRHWQTITLHETPTNHRLVIITDTVNEQTEALEVIVNTERCNTRPTAGRCNGRNLKDVQLFLSEWVSEWVDS